MMVPNRRRWINDLSKDQYIKCWTVGEHACHMRNAHGEGVIYVSLPLV
jgi:hypothetical protein